MRPILLLSMLSLAACAAPSPEGTAGPRRPVFSRTEGSVYVEIPADHRALGTTLQLAPAAVWPRLIQVYAGLELPVTTLQQGEMRIGNGGFTIRRRIAGLPAARVFDCGRGRGGAMVADMYPIQVSLHTEVSPTPEGGARVETRLLGVAQDAGGNSTNPVRCGSTGALERRIVERLQELGGS